MPPIVWQCQYTSRWKGHKYVWAETMESQCYFSSVLIFKCFNQLPQLRLHSRRFKLWMCFRDTESDSVMNSFTCYKGNHYRPKSCSIHQSVCSLFQLAAMSGEEETIIYLTEQIRICFSSTLSKFCKWIWMDARLGMPWVLKSSASWVIWL